RYIEDEDGGDPLPDETSAQSRYRDGAARARLQSHPRDENYGHSAADGRDPSIVTVEKWLVYRLAQFKPLLAKRFETTKTRSRHQTMVGPHAVFADCIMTQPRKPDRIPAEFRIGGQAMESVIAKLLQDLEQGKRNRRRLIQSLSLGAAAAAGIAPAARAAGKPLEALYVNHISYEVNDYKKVRDFYVDLLGMKVTEDDGKQCR